MFLGFAWWFLNGPSTGRWYGEPGNMVCHLGDVHIDRTLSVHVDCNHWFTALINPILSTHPPPHSELFGMTMTMIYHSLSLWYDHIDPASYGMKQDSRGLLFHVMLWMVQRITVSPHW